MIGHVPDFLHCLVFDGMPWVGRKPLGERVAFGVGAIGFMQAHAPMRGGIGDCVVGFWVVCFAHRLSRLWAF
ncbi:hypothetical protein D3C85_1495680 [compost metagenome]